VNVAMEEARASQSRGLILCEEGDKSILLSGANLRGHIYLAPIADSGSADSPVTRYQGGFLY